MVDGEDGVLEGKERDGIVGRLCRVESFGGGVDGITWIGISLFCGICRDEILLCTSNVL